MQIDILNTMNRTVSGFFIGMFGSHVGIYLAFLFNFLVGVLLVWALIMPFWCLLNAKSREEYEDDEDRK